MLPSPSICAGNAAAVLVKKFNAVNARIGDRSIPPNGGMMPRNKFKYGSQIVANGYTICCGAAGNHVTINLPINRVLYMFNVENNPEVKTTSTAESPGIIAPKNLFPRMGTMISFIVFLLFLLLLLCLLLYCAALMLAQNTAFTFFASLFSEMFFLAELKPDRAACRNSFRGLKRNDVDDDEEDDATAIALPNCAIGEVIDVSIPLPCSSFVVIIVLLLLLIIWMCGENVVYRTRRVKKCGVEKINSPLSVCLEHARRKERFSFFARKQV